MGVTDPLRSEHAQLLPRLESLTEAARALEDSGNEVPAALDTVLVFLHDSLIPHAQAEDAVLYPMVEQVMKAPGATATMSRDHVEVVTLTADLQRLRDSLHAAPEADQRRDLQRLLYGLYAIIRLHFAKEEELYLPVLDAGLGAAEAAEMFRAMHESAHAGGSAHQEPAHNFASGV
jgi:iron-sulfur cluster repair protein YtfE (RIC family)